MVHKACTRLEQLLASVPASLREIDDEAFAQKESAEKWSKKQIIGHLIDSAANNHQRFVRMQFEENPAIGYDQSQWNATSRYQDMDKALVIGFWETYNRFLLEIMKRIPAENLQRSCLMKDGSTPNLEFILVDYVAHMEHHLEQVLG